MSGTSILDENPRLKRIIEDAEKHPSPVVALTIATVRRQEKDKIYDLVGWDGRCSMHGEIDRFISVMRRPETNVTHPNILSAPTDRVPHAIFHAMTDGPTVEPVQKPRHGGYTFYKPQPVASENESGHHPLVYAVDSILAKKMGVARELEEGVIRYRAWLAVVCLGYASYPLHCPYEKCVECAHEPMRMANVVVEVDDDTMDRFPEQSAAYNEIRRTPLGVFMSRYRRGGKGGHFLRRPGDSVESEDYISGLCLPSSLDVLRQFDGEQTREKMAKLNS